VHYREVLVKEKIKAFRINESVLEAFRIILDASMPDAIARGLNKRFTGR